MKPKKQSQNPPLRGVIRNDEHGRVAVFMTRPPPLTEELRSAFKRAGIPVR